MNNLTYGNNTIYFSWGPTIDYIFYNASGYASGVHPSAGGSTNYTTTRSWIVARDSSDDTSIWIDGDNTVSDSTTWGPATVATECLISSVLMASSYGATGEVYEMAIWDSDLSAANRNEIGDYVIAKYGLSFDDF
jgi:hypothetical protein